MTQLLGLSFDSATSPSIRLRAIDLHEERLEQHYGWGLAWYPGGSSAMVIKDPTSTGHNALTNILSKWERFSSSVFVAHLRGAAKRTRQQDTHPFVRSYAGRDWVLTHNGDLRHDFREVLELRADCPFEPVGRTDTEHILCWLLQRIYDNGFRTLAAVGWDRLTGWLREVNRLGTLNLVLSDGTDTVGYSDAFGYKNLHWTRRTPPQPLIRYRSADVDLKLGTSADLSRTMIVLSTVPLSDEGWEELPGGSMIVARLGSVRFQSEPLPADWVTPDSADDDLETSLPPDVARQAQLLTDDIPENDPALPGVGPLAPTVPERSDVIEVDPPFEDDDDEIPTAPAHDSIAMQAIALRRAAQTAEAPEVFTAGLSRAIEEESRAAEHSADPDDRPFDDLHLRESD